MKTIATLLLLVSVAVGQTNVLTKNVPRSATAVANLPSRQSITTDREADNYVDKPRHDHHKRNFWIAFGITAGVGVALAWKLRGPHCNHYEYGQNGVNMPCPVESKDSK